MGIEKVPVAIVDVEVACYNENVVDIELMVL